MMLPSFERGHAVLYVLSQRLAPFDGVLMLGAPKAFLRLAGEAFEHVESRTVGDSLRMPASHFMMVLSGARS